MDIEPGTRVNAYTQNFEGIAFSGIVTNVRWDGVEATGYEVEHGQPGMDDPMWVAASVVRPATTAYECNDIDCDRVGRHWPIFDDEHGIQVDDAATIEEAQAKAGKVVE